MAIGHYEYVPINPFELVVLPQVRKTKNARIDEIADSIADKGLINPIDVARLTYDELKNHINFLNQLWKKNININSFTPVNGYYYVVIAGHTRLEGIKRNAERNICNDDIEVKIHKVKTSREILAIQLDENIHTEPRIEERAIAIIETYRLGIINGEWKDKAEFILKNKDKFSRHVLNDALIFADLPVEVQEYIFSYRVPYAIGVELGRIFSLIQKYEADFDKSGESVEINIRFHYANLLNQILQVDSIKKALIVLSGHAKTLDDHFRPKEELQQEILEFWGDGVNRQSEFHHEQLVNDYNKTRRDLCGMPFEKIVELLRLDKNLTGEDHSSDIQHINQLYHPFLQECFFNSQLSIRRR
jgi:hypothetical protein